MSTWALKAGPRRELREELGIDVLGALYVGTVRGEGLHGAAVHTSYRRRRTGTNVSTGRCSHNFASCLSKICTHKVV